MLVSSRKGLVLWLYGVLKKHPHRGQKNQVSQVVTLAPVSTRHLSVFRICKLLLLIHPEIQFDSCTTYLDVEDFREY